MADHQPAAAPSEVAVGLDRLSRLVSRARSGGADPLRRPWVTPGLVRGSLPRGWTPRASVRRKRGPGGRSSPTNCRATAGRSPPATRRIFPTRLSPERQAVPEFETTAQGCRLPTSVGGVRTGRGAT
jgi:hypothetical protein